VERIEQNSYLDHVPGASRAGRNDRKGKQPLTKLALSRATRRMPESVSRSPSAKETLRIVLARLEDMKAEDSVTIDLAGKSSISDYMVVTSGRSQRHVGAVAEHVIKDIKAAGVPSVRVEGMRQGDWVLIDAGDVIVHVFRPEVREFYNLEKMWSAGSTDRKRPN
jgi:ribosome-associated protein